jgi:hypothetical protein
LKTDINVPSRSKKLNKKKNTFCSLLEGHGRKEQDPAQDPVPNPDPNLNPEVSGTDPQH